MPTPRVAAIHDLSCFGRCALTVALPVLSAMGLQCCPLPTALLSAHTGFSGSTFLDLTDSLWPIAAHWWDLRLSFQAVYTGFLASPRQADAAAAVWRQLRAPETLIILDPVMGDHGQLYRTCTPELCRRMGQLSLQADLITPNLTEAALLLDLPYREVLELDPRETVRRLSLEGKRSVVLTGYSADPRQIGALCFDRCGGAVHAVQVPRAPLEIHGTGDLFASVLTGAMARGQSLSAAAETAADFVHQAAAYTAAAKTPPLYGLEFEPLLWSLSPRALDASASDGSHS